MSIYNAIRGYNPHVTLALAMLGFVSTAGIPRFRNAWLSNDGAKIVLLTRTGGGNREEYAAQNAELAKWPGYVEDRDDSYDSTYAHFTFDVPEEFREDTAKLAALLVRLNNGAEHWGPESGERAILGTLPVSDEKPEDLKNDPQINEAYAAYERIISTVSKRLRNKLLELVTRNAVPPTDARN